MSDEIKKDRIITDETLRETASHGSEEEVDDLYEKLKMYSDVNEEIKQKHINDFKK